MWTYAGVEGGYFCCGIVITSIARDYCMARNLHESNGVIDIGLLTR